MNSAKTSLAKKMCSVLSKTVPFLSVMVFAVEAPAQVVENLFFASDVHDMNDELQERVGSLCPPEYCSLIGLVGDYASGWSTASDLGTILSDTSYTIDYEPAHILASQGNHDAYNPYYTMYGLFQTGPVYLWGTHSYYDVFILNTGGFVSGCETLRNYIDSYPANSKTLVVMSHYPLHSTRLSTEEQVAAKSLFTKLNTAGDESHHKNILFVWGHNHRDTSYDENVRMVAVPGDTIRESGTTGGQLIDDVANAPLTFTYLNAGYIQGYSPAYASTATVVSLIYGQYMMIDRQSTDPNEDDFMFLPVPHPPPAP